MSIPETYEGRPEHLAGSGIVEPAALDTIRRRLRDDCVTSEWYAYQNVALDGVGLGDLIFLQCGPGCTLREPPEIPADMTYIDIIGWRYRRVGRVDIGRGVVVEYPRNPVPANPKDAS